MLFGVANPAADARMRDLARPVQAPDGIDLDAKGLGRLALGPKLGNTKRVAVHGVSLLA